MNERVFNQNIEKLRSEERRERLEVKRVVDLSLDHEPVSFVLDIGTGSGLFAEEFANRGFRVFGVDPNPEMIEAAKQFVPEARFYNAQAENLPFNDSSFDVVFFGLVLHEVDDYLKALKEASRVTRKEAAILEWEYAAQEFGPPLEHRLKKEFIEELALKAGFKNVEVHKLKNLVLYKLLK
ncbi:MAG TPA: class I SAM-dependent methyltransferase [Ignavibacteriales bacterium]|nr:class I SAM-dependent methyltransferase [Ignavibacteriales bacterium]